MVKAKVLSVTASYEGVVVDGSKDPHSKIERFAEVSEKLDACIDEYVDTVNEIESVIEQLKDARFRLVLRERYLNNSKWEDIRSLMNYEDVRTVYVIHGNALKAAEPYIPEVMPMQK